MVEELYPQSDLHLIHLFILGIEIIIGTGIRGGGAEVEVGGGMTVISTVEKRKITVIGAEVAALITTKVVGEVNMMRKGAAVVGLMEGRTFLIYILLLISLSPWKTIFISFI